jgi:hypothetical protein
MGVGLLSGGARLRTHARMGGGHGVMWVAAAIERQAASEHQPGQSD